MADAERLGVDEHEGRARHLLAAVDPGVIGAALDQDVMRAPRSSTSSPIEMSAGAPSVDQIRVEVAPEAPALALVAGPSMITLATLFRSWPVTTRRIGGNFGWPVLIALRSPCRGRPQAIGRLAIGGIEPHSCHYGAFVARGFLL